MKQPELQQELRQELRLHSEETVFLEIAAASADGRQPAEVLVSRSTDISTNGLQVIVNQPLSIGRLLSVAIQLDSEPAPLTLVTEVKWCRPAERPDLWAVGLAILESDDTGIALWKQRLAGRLSQPVD